jgi:hypothetical protein
MNWANRHAPGVPAKIWLLLAAGPALFLFAFALVSIAFGMAGAASDQIEAKVVSLVPHVLSFVLVCLGVGTARMKTEVRRLWQVSPDTRVLVDAVIGALCGTCLAGAYFLWLAPLMELLQASVGDFVPSGSVGRTLAGSMGAFFVANVALAPVVEETLYRGIGLPVLADRLGTAAGLAISCLAFGLLHWTGGLWYMLLTGLIAGGSFAGLYLWRGGIVAPFTAHLVLDLIEFGYAYAARGAAR